MPANSHETSSNGKGDGNGEKRTANVIFIKCDVRKRADLEELVKAAERTWSAVPDVWVAGAGVFEPVCLSLLS